MFMNNGGQLWMKTLTGFDVAVREIYSYLSNPVTKARGKLNSS